jgi:hypothetical protein
MKVTKATTYMSPYQRTARGPRLKAMGSNWGWVSTRQLSQSRALLPRNESEAYEKHRERAVERDAASTANRLKSLPSWANAGTKPAIPTRRRKMPR